MEKRKCSNCGKQAPLTQMLVVNDRNRPIALLCDGCQDAKKIQITLEKDKRGNWKFYQYFPVEG